jgi:hypothetical protein
MFFAGFFFVFPLFLKWMITSPMPTEYWNELYPEFPVLVQQDFITQGKARDNVITVTDIPRTWSGCNHTCSTHGGTTRATSEMNLGLRENATKEQWMHRQPSHRRRLAEAGVAQESVKDSATILGTKVTGGASRPPSDKEKQRWNKATAQVRAAARLPIDFASKVRVVQSGPFSSAEYGWLEQPPRKQDSDQLLARVWDALAVPRQSAVPLRLLVIGHRTDPRYRAQQHAVGAILRATRKAAQKGTATVLDIPWAAGKKGYARLLSKHLEWTGWKPQQHHPWTWRHDGIDKHLSIDPDSEHWHTPKLAEHTFSGRPGATPSTRPGGSPAGATPPAQACPTRSPTTASRPWWTSPRKSCESRYDSSQGPSSLRRRPPQQPRRGVVRRSPSFPRAPSAATTTEPLTT